ncbi:MAG TPA: hypothetical protein VMO47_00205 [Rhodothermales bacterium]|nr:hypothetical protein [Rhodothermales bacterium]
MTKIVTLENGDCRVAATASGEITFSVGHNCLMLPPQGGESESVTITEVDGRIRIERRRGGFRLVRTLSRPEGNPCLLRVTCAAAADRTGPFDGLVDRWSSSLKQPHDYRWAPNLRPEREMRVGSHCFRSPVVMVSGIGGWAALIPDFESETARRDARLCALDLDATAVGEVMLGYGLEPTRPVGHVLFEIDPAAEAAEGDVFRFDYYLLLSPSGSGADMLRTVNAFLWSQFAAPYLDDKLPQTVPFDLYADYGYPSLISTPLFVRFTLGGGAAGGISAESAHADYFRRPHPVIWNQYWFNNQRAAYGLGANGTVRHEGRWLEAGRLMTATTLSAPRWDGLWPALYAYDQDEWWGSIPRLNGGKRRVHVADAALTGEWLFHWVNDVERSGAGLSMVRSLADCLCRLQQVDGSIPPWFDWDDTGLRADETLNHSAETGAATAFLAAVAGHPDFGDVVPSVLHGAEFLAAEVMKYQRYQDFETFYSCSPKKLDMVDPYTGIMPQNSLAVHWTARTMLGAYRLTHDGELLKLAIQATDSLSLYQQVWNPPFLSLFAFGGFGVMNTDAEWNDARQSLFAPHYFEMYEATGLKEYLERGRAALRASFALASIPENAGVSPNTFDSYPPGLMPENYGHSGRDTPAGRSDACWGEAGALTSVAFIRLRHPGLLDDLDDA